MNKDLETAYKIAYNKSWVKVEKPLNKNKVIKDATTVVEEEHQNKLRMFGKHYRFEPAQNYLTFYRRSSLGKVLGSINSDEKTIEACEKRLVKSYKRRDFLQLEYDTIVSRGVTLREEMLKQKEELWGESQPN